MSVTAAQVKELRDRTGAAMMDCKKALVETNGDIEAAIEAMRKSGQAKADKKAGRTAAEGVVYAMVDESGHKAVLLEVNCETDFVAKDDNFCDFVKQVAELIMTQTPKNVEDLLALQVESDKTVDETRKALIAKIGENVQVRRFEIIESEGTVGQYVHGGRIGVLANLNVADEELAKDLAMHIAANAPLVTNQEDVPADVLEKEKEIFMAQAENSGKPKEIIEKMTQGRIKKFLDEVSLLGQAFVKDPNTKVSKLLDAKNAKVNHFVRYEVGEGIEKEATNFAEEVMAQVKG